MRIVFFGSDDFAAVNLRALLGAGAEVAACVTPPEKARGRGLTVVPCPVTRCAREQGIRVLQPERLRDPVFLESVGTLAADLFVVIAYGKILPQELLAVPRLFSVNVHASLLPRYRGAAPINWAVMNGDRETGVSVIRLNPRMDAGDIIAQAPVGIDDKDTAVTLRARLAQTGAGLLCQAVESFKTGQHTFTAQDEARVTFAPKLTKALGRINWKDPAVRIHDYVRGLQPWPSSYTFYKDSLLKILDTEVADAPAETPGTVTRIVPEGFVVSTTDRGLLVKSVHPASSRPMPAASFIAGHKVPVGFMFP